MKIIIDTREQRPFAFLGQNGDIETERGTLSLGDYSLAGLTDRVAVERKSLADLVMCLGKERERFQRELMRAAGKAMSDPWGRCDVDEWTAEEILANALLDPLPAGLGWDDVGGRANHGESKSKAGTVAGQRRPGASKV